MTTRDLIQKGKEEELFKNQTILPLADELLCMVKPYKLTYKQAKVLFQVLSDKLESNSVLS